MSLELFPIRNDDDHERAVRLIAIFWNAPEGSPEEAYMDALATLVDAYERVHYPIPAASPVEVIRFAMEQNERTQADLAEVLGSKSRASEVLSGRRGLSMEHIRRLHQAWHIPVASLIGEMADA